MAKKISRNYWLIDASKKPVGRIATIAATLLMGKHKSEYQPHLDYGDYVIVKNASKLFFSGNKEKEKEYFHHSGYPGGLKRETPFELRTKGKIALVIRRAIAGMLPKNSLRKNRLKRLQIFPLEPENINFKMKEVNYD